MAGKYALLSIIGQGAMGVVYRARQIALEKTVALKVLSHELRGNPEFVMRFHTEARAASRLDHPNSTRVLDFGEEPDGLLYIAMELLQGRTLAELVENEFPLATERVASIMSQTLSAVGAAHALKILHRDLKPENIVILEGRDDEDRHIDVVKVCDFGIAKLDGAAEPAFEAAAAPSLVTAKATSAGVVMGTPQYMSPEQARGETLDVRSDIYSLGVVLFEMLTKRAPFNEGTAADVLYKHSFVDPPTPSTLQPNVDPALEAICLRALRKQRDERFATARDMRVAFKPFTRDRPQPDITPRIPDVRDVEASAPTISATSVSAKTPTRRRRRALWLLPVALCAIAAVAFNGSRHGHELSTAPALQSTAMGAPVPVAAQKAKSVLVDRASSPAPEAVLVPRKEREMTRPRASRVDAPVIATAIAAAMITTATSVSTASDPLAIAPPPPPPVGTVTAVAQAVVTVARADPTRARVDLGSVRADRVNAGSVEVAVRHVDFTGCYRTEVAASRLAEGTATLTLDMDGESVTHADVIGGAFSPTLRQCIARRVTGLRVANVDTGDATARVTLRFSLQ